MSVCITTVLCTVKDKEIIKQCSCTCKRATKCLSVEIMNSCPKSLIVNILSIYVHITNWKFLKKHEAKSFFPYDAIVELSLQFAGCDIDVMQIRIADYMQVTVCS